MKFYYAGGRSVELSRVGWSVIHSVSEAKLVETLSLWMRLIPQTLKINPNEGHNSTSTSRDAVGSVSGVLNYLLCLLLKEIALRAEEL